MKVINPRRKSSYGVRKLKTTAHFSIVDDLKHELAASLESEVTVAGYISPGHGMKGKQNPLEVDDDLVEMYAEYQSKREILLWCFATIEENSVAVPETQKSRKRDRNSSSDPGPVEPQTTSKRAACEKKIQEVEDIISTLKEKHGSKYSIEKYNAWAHMLHVGKHDSHDTPPNLPFFGRQSRSDNSGSDRPKASDPSSLSPAKRVQLRSECIEQLDRLHSLLEKGGVPHEDYDNLQKAILGDIFGNLKQ